jgi:3-oxoacyl-(acyl-carrier-protein) synthase/acyl carrier protein
MAAVAQESRDVLAEVRQSVEATLRMQANQLDVDADLEGFGVDSIIIMELMAKLSRQFGVSLTPAQFMQLKTLRDLADYIGRSGQPPVVSSTLAAGPAPKSVDGHVPTVMVMELPGDRLARQAALANATPEPAMRSIREPARRLQQRDSLSRESTARLREHIAGKYGIDLERLEYASLDAIVDELLAAHHHVFVPPAQTTEEAGVAISVTRPSESGIRQQDPARLSEDIAIVGMSCRFPDATGLQAYWNNLMSGRSSIREVPESRWKWQQHYSESVQPGKTVSRWGAFIEDVDCFDATLFGIAAQDAQRMDPQERLLCEEVYEAFRDAGIDVGRLSGSNTGVFIGYEYAEYEQLLRSRPHRSADTPAFSSSSPAYYLANRLSFAFDFTGPSEAINVNCASSAVAINRAHGSLATGESDVAVAAGVCLNLFAGDYVAASQYRLLSPNGTCAVFDDNANGFTRGEGVGVLVLKRLTDARRDNNRIYGVIKACSQNNRGRAASLSDIKHEAITDVLSRCYRKAALQPSDISYIEVDGYCTKWGDSFEFEGIKNVFRDLPPGRKFCALGSVKGNIGHLEPASGMASVIKVALSMYHGTFPPTITARTLNEFVDIESPSHPLYLAQHAIPFEGIRSSPTAPIRAGISSFSDSGSNVHILIEEFVPQQTRTPEPGSPQQELFVVSAANARRLDAQLEAFVEMLASERPRPQLQDVAFTLQTGRQGLPARLAIVAASLDELHEKIVTFRSSSDQQRCTLGARGIFYGDSSSTGSNPLLEIITEAMVSMQLQQARQLRRWREVALLWVNGVVIPWAAIWSDQAASVVSLPRYPFARDRYWIDAIDAVADVLPQPAASASTLLAAAARDATGCATPAAPKRQRVPAETSSDTRADAVQKMDLFLRQELANQLDLAAHEIPGDRNYLELGVNSLGVISLSRKVNQFLGVRLSPSVFVKYPDVQQSAAYLGTTYREQIDRMEVTADSAEAEIAVGIAAPDWQELAAVSADEPSWIEAAALLPELSSDAATDVISSHARLMAEVLWSADADDGSYEKITF